MAMRSLILWFTISCLLMQNISNLLIVANFQLNRDYIAKNLCIKKEEVNNCCKGSCHLTKQLENDKKKQEKSERNKTEIVQCVQLCENASAFGFLSFADKSSKNNFHYLTSFSEGIPSSIFHPPLG